MVMIQSLLSGFIFWFILFADVQPVEINDSDTETPKEPTDEEELSKCLELDVHSSHYYLDQLWKGWKSPIYQFFHKVSIKYDGMRKYHFFHCGAPHCKGRVSGVRRFLDTGDCAATSNLKTHVINCWGEDIVTAAMNRVKTEGRDGDQDNEDDVDADEPEAEDPDDLSYLNANTDNDDEDDEALDIGGKEDKEEVNDDGIDELDDLGPYTWSALLWTEHKKSAMPCQRYTFLITLFNN